MFRNIIMKMMELVNRDTRHPLAPLMTIMAIFGFSLAAGQEFTVLAAQQMGGPRPTIIEQATSVEAEPIPDWHLALNPETSGPKFKDLYEKMLAGQPINEEKPELAELLEEFEEYREDLFEADVAPETGENPSEEADASADELSEPVPTPPEAVNIDDIDEEPVNEVNEAEENADGSAVDFSGTPVAHVDELEGPTYEEQLIWLKNHIYYYFSEADIHEITLVVQSEDEISNSETEWAAHTWAILSRLDATGFAQNDTVHGVLTAKGQFTCYSAAMKKTPRADIANVVIDVMARYIMEKCGAPEDEVGRVLPANYYYWNGNKNGTHNIFYTGWQFENPYKPTRHMELSPYDT